MDSPERGFTEAGRFLREHWQVVGLGAVALIGAAYVLLSGSGTPASTTAAPAGTVATVASGNPGGVSDAVQIAGLQANAATTLANIQGTVAVDTATIAAQSAATQAGITAGATAYNTTTQALANLSASTNQTAANQSIQAMSALEQGFTSNTLAGAQVTSNALASSAAIAGSNDKALGNTLSGVASVVGTVMTGGASSAFNAFGSAYGRYAGSSPSGLISAASVSGGP